MAAKTLKETIMKLSEIKLTATEEIIKLEIEKLFQEKIIEFDLTNWKLKWTTNYSQYGQCNNQKEIIQISLPIAVSNSEQGIDTLLHELAHALTPNCGHNDEWKQMCIKIGATPERCAKSIKTRFDNEIKPVTKTSKTYILSCPACNFYTTRTRKSNSSSSCPKCSNSYNEQFKLNWKEYVPQYIV